MRTITSIGEGTAFVLASGAGISLALYAIWIISRHPLINRWPTAEGVITKSEIKKIEGADDTTYIPDISYEYPVNGQSFYGTKVVDHRVSFFTSEPVNRWCEKYPIGAKVIVYYSPSNPVDSVLEKSISIQTYLCLLAGLCLLAFVVCYWILNHEFGFNNEV